MFSSNDNNNIMKVQMDVVVYAMLLLMCLCEYSSIFTPCGLLNGIYLLTVCRPTMLHIGLHTYQGFFQGGEGE